MRFIWNNAHCSTVKCILFAVRMQKIMHLHRFHHNSVQNAKANQTFFDYPETPETCLHYTKTANVRVFYFPFHESCICLFVGLQLALVYYFQCFSFASFSMHACGNAFNVVVTLFCVCTWFMAAHLFISHLTMRARIHSNAHNSMVVHSAYSFVKWHLWHSISESYISHSYSK